MTSRWLQEWREFRDSLGSVISFPADYFAGWFGVAPSESGVEVNELTAMQIAAYVGCVRILGDAVSSTPLNVFERLDDGSEKIALNHPLQPVLRLAPNRDCTSADLFHAGQTHLNLTGNCYLEIGYNGAGQPAGLFLRNPFRTIPYRWAKGGPSGYDLEPGDLYYLTNDSPTGYERLIRAGDMVHIKGMGMDGLVGLSPVKYYAREVLGGDLAAQSYSAKFFANDSRPGGYLRSPGFRDPDQKLKDAQTWVAAHSRGNARRVAILDGGMEWVNVGVPPEEAQFLQTREFNRTQIACIFGVPPHFLGEAAESRANMEQRALEFLTFTLKPWLNKWEQMLNVRLFSSVGRNAGRFFVRFDTSQFERATYADLLKGVQMGRYAGLVTVQEGRKLLGMQPYTKKQLDSDDPADKLWQPVNMAWVTDKWDEEPADPAAGGGEGQGGNDQDGGDGSGKSAGGTGQGGKRFADPDAELRHYLTLFGPTFRDAFGRILSRKNSDEADFQRCFSPVLTSVATAFECDPATREPGDMRVSEQSIGFIAEYIRGMKHRSSQWNKSDECCSNEFTRAIAELRKKCQPPAPAESDQEEDE